MPRGSSQSYAREYCIVVCIRSSDNRYYHLSQVWYIEFLGRHELPAMQS